MHKGADIAKATADISLLKDDIMSVALAKELANKTMKLISSNFRSTVGVNTAILSAATLGMLNPIATAIASQWHDDLASAQLNEGREDQSQNKFERIDGV